MDRDTTHYDASATPLGSEGSERDLTFPALFFDSFINITSYSHAALLVLECTGNYFSPTASLGLDHTTIHRLRIPREILAQNSSIARDPISVFKNSERQFLEPFFSVREYGLYSTFVLVPFQKSSQVFSFFLVVSTAEDKIDESLANSLIEKLKDGPMELHDKYYAWLEKLPAYPEDAFSPEYLGKIDSLIDHIKHMNKQLLIIELNMTALLNSILSRLKFSDEKRILGDMETILYSFSAGLGLYFRKSDKNVLIGFPVKSAHDHQFMVDHLLGVLSNCYPHAQVSPGIILSTKTMSEINLNARELLSSL